MRDKRTPEEREILSSWPKVTAEDIREMNALFPAYLFFRPDKEGTRFWASCCGRSERLERPRRTEFPWEAKLLNSLKHNGPCECPWCGRPAAVKDLRKAGQRKALESFQCAVLLHGREDALYADAVALRKGYETEESLTAPPVYWLSSMYRFAAGDVMEVDFQECEKGRITHERERLGRAKRVQEPFKKGSISWYMHEPYAVLNREELERCPAVRYSCYFSHWNPESSYFSDFVSYMTACCIYPRQVEMLAKAGLREPVNALLSARKKFAGAMKWEEPDIRRAMGLTAPELREVLEKKPPMLALELRNLAQRWFGQRWTASRAAGYLNLWGEEKARHVLSFCRHFRLDPQCLTRYLERQEGRLRDAFDEYRDYLETAWALGLCLEHGRVLWPEDLRAAHDELTARWVRRQEEKIARLPAEKGLAKANERAGKYSFELDGLLMAFPLTAAAIRREGKALEHCVGGYAERHIKGVVTILFLRKASAPNTPYVTVEMDGNRIVQAHGYRNDRGGESPRVTHRKFFDAWLAWLKAGSRRDRDGKPVLPGKTAETRRESA